MKTSTVNYLANFLTGLIFAVCLSLLVFVIDLAIKTFNKYSSKQKPHIGYLDTVPRVSIVSTTFIRIDNNGHIMEAETNDVYSVYNYKKVPQHGLYTDTKQTNDSTGSDVCSAVFIDGKLVHLVCVVQPLTHYGDKRIWYYTNHDKN